MKEIFNNIDKYDQIIGRIAKASSPDGEDLTFEFKGSDGITTLTKELKAICAAEICSFANTYGGILCFHFGKGTEIQKFPKGICKNIFQSIESWLNDCLEARHLGVDIKIVEDVFLINVPESKTKPHKTAGLQGNYYYRTSTSALRMPEIMISSMYRSQDFLNFKVNLNVFRENANDLHLHLKIENISNVVGTKPKITLKFWGVPNYALHFQATKDFEQSGSFKSIVKNSDSTIPLNGYVSSTTLFREELLYQKDYLSINHQGKGETSLNGVHYILVEVDVLFKESIRYTEVFLFDISLEKTSKILGSTQNLELKDLINKCRS